MVSLEFLPVQNQYLYVFPFRIFFSYFCTFSTSMLLFGTLGNNSRRKVEVVKLLILKYYLQFVVPITFMIRIRRKLSSILVKSISTPKPGNLWTTSRLSVCPTGPQTLWHRVWTKGPCPGDPGDKKHKITI